MFETELSRAVQAGEVKRVAELLKTLKHLGNCQKSKKEELSTRSQYNILTKAVTSGHADIVKLLLDMNFQFVTNDSRINLIRPPLLHTAIRSNHLPIVKHLLAAGADPNSQKLIANDSVGRKLPALSEAIVAQNESMVELLLDHGADAKFIYNTQTFTPLIEAALTGNARIIEKLLDHGANAYHMGPYGGMNALCCAVKSGNVEAVELMLTKGIEVDAGDRTALFTAVDERRVEMIDCLLLFGARADFNQTGPVTGTPLHLAAKKCQTDAIKKFLQQGFDVNARNAFGETPLHCCASSAEANVLDTMRYLLDHGASVDDIYAQGESPLFYAARSPFALSVDLMQLLVDCGASVNRRNNKGETVVQAALDAPDSKNAIALLKIIVGLRSKGFVVCEEVLKYIESQPDLQDYFRQYEDELTHMINTEIEGARITVYDLLQTEDEDKMKEYVRKDAIVGFVASSALEERYPAHVEMVQRFLNKFIELCY